MTLIFLWLMTFALGQESLTADEKFKRAQNHYSNFEYPQSLAYLRSTLEQDQFHANSLRLLSLIHEQNKEYFKALKIHYKLLRYLYSENILKLEAEELKKKKVPQLSDEAEYSLLEVIRLSFKMLDQKRYKDKSELKRIIRKYLIILEKDKKSLDKVYFYYGMLALNEIDPQTANFYFKEYQKLDLKDKTSPEMSSFIEIYRSEYVNNENFSEYFWRLDTSLGFDSNPYSLDKQYYKGNETQGDSFQSFYGSVGRKIHVYSQNPSEWTINYFRRSYQKEDFYNAEESHYKLFYETSTRQKKENRFFHKMFYEWHRFTDFRSLSNQTVKHVYSYHPGIEFYQFNKTSVLNLELNYITYREIIDLPSHQFHFGLRYKAQEKTNTTLLNPGYGASLGQTNSTGDLKSSMDFMWQIFNDSYFFQDQKFTLKFKSTNYFSSDDFTNLAAQNFESIYYIPMNLFDISFYMEIQKLKNEYINVTRNIYGVNLVLSF